LFAGIDDSQLLTLLNCLAATERQCDKNEFVFTAGSTAKSIGIVLAGSVYALKEDYYSNRAILAHITPGNLFGEAFSCAETDNRPSVSSPSNRQTSCCLITEELSQHVLLSASFMQSLSRIWWEILAQKNIMLTQKIEIITKKTTREKLLAISVCGGIKSRQQSLCHPI